MSSTTQPIDSTRFGRALEDLPLDALYAKVAELRNSLAHLKSSNEQMLPFADAGDQDCKEAMFENLGVIGRVNERLALLRVEIEEKRGMMWHSDDATVDVPEMTNGDAVDPRDTEQQPVHGTNGGRLGDDELARELERRMAEDDEGDDENGNGIYL